MDLTLVRHGEPVRGVPDDPPLSERGMAHARQAAAFLAAERYDALYVSPLRRARETAEVIAKELGLDPVVDDRLAEFDRDGPYEHFEDLVATRDPRVEALLRGDLSAWGADVDQFRAQVRVAFDEIISRHRGQHVVVVSHGGVANVFFGSVLGIDKLTFHAPAYCSVSRARAGVVRTLVSLNECGHLDDRAGIPTIREGSLRAGRS